jgi:hypothetical protein
MSQPKFDESSVAASHLLVISHRMLYTLDRGLKPAAGEVSGTSRYSVTHQAWVLHVRGGPPGARTRHLGIKSRFGSRSQTIVTDQYLLLPALLRTTHDSHACHSSPVVAQKVAHGGDYRASRSSQPDRTSIECSYISEVGKRVPQHRYR